MTEQEAINRISYLKNKADVALSTTKSNCSWVKEDVTGTIKALDMAIKALEKDIPQSVKLYIGQDMKCPSCNNRLRNYEGMMIGYCKYCGQLLIR